MWTYHADPAMRVTTGRYFALIADAPTANECMLIRAEFRRQLRPTSVMEWLAGVAVPYAVNGGRYRVAVIGLPYRAWRFGEVLGQLRHLGHLRARVSLADTHQTSEAGLIWNNLTEALGDAIAVPFADVGTAVLDVVGATAEATVDVGAGVSQALPGVGRGARDVLVGAGDLVESTGAGARNLGWFASLSPTMTVLLVLAAVGTYLAMSSGALRFAPIKLGGR